MIAQVAFAWDGVKYTKGDVLPVFNPSAMRHLSRRGYASNTAVMTVGRPFVNGTTIYAVGDATPVGLTDVQLRRLIAGRYLV